MPRAIYKDKVYERRLLKGSNSKILKRSIKLSQLTNIAPEPTHICFPQSAQGCRDERKGGGRANSCKPDEKEVLEGDTRWKLDPGAEGGARARFLSRGATGSGFTILVTCDLLSPTGQRHCTGSKEVWCHFSDLRLLPRRLRVRGQTGHQHAYEHAAVACTGRGHAHGNPPPRPCVPLYFLCLEQKHCTR